MDNQLKQYYEEMVNNKLFFKRVFNTLDQNRVDAPLVVESLDEKSKKCLDEINESGITKYEGFFDESELEEIIKFQSKIDYLTLGKGSINKDYGKTRFSSKTNGWPAGSDIIKNNVTLNSIFKNYYKDEKCEFYRSLLEWVYPSENNHIGWHTDVVFNQLKVMVLLSDVDFENAPMYYAKNSHRINTEEELDIKHALFIHSTSTLYPRKFWGKHKAAIVGNTHAGYLSDEWVDNAPEVIDDKPIVIRNSEYEKEVATGKTGDIIIFESSGFHSGNKCISGIRKSFGMSCPDDFSVKNKFLKAMGKRA